MVRSSKKKHVHMHSYAPFGSAFSSQKHLYQSEMSKNPAGILKSRLFRLFWWRQCITTESFYRPSDGCILIRWFYTCGRYNTSVNYYTCKSKTSFQSGPYQLADICYVAAPTSWLCTLSHIVPLALSAMQMVQKCERIYLLIIYSTLI